LRWQKVGFYLIAASTVVAVLIALFVFESGLQSFLPLVGLGILYALLRPKWALFS
ncbi:MAG: hypothetical protein H7175_28125, partial [Burkholderiales bacterium]|nr:hypothetical protein [Anaerolineae bacterium]